MAFLILSNLFSGIMNIFRSYQYQTENAEFEFATMPSTGRDIAMMERVFTDFKDVNPQYKDLKLYRVFKPNLLEFWNWYSFLTDEMYDIEYKDKVPSVSGKGRLGI